MQVPMWVPPASGSRAPFPEARIIAIEPDPNNAEVLRLNVEGLARITVLEAAIAGTSGKVSLRRDGLSWGIQTVRTASASLQAITADQALATVPSGDLFL